MNYFSTRGGVKGVSFKNAVMSGLAADGGLFLPESYPQIDIARLRGKSYPEIAFEVMHPFADGVDNFEELIHATYAPFDASDVVPLKYAGGFNIAELFHGPTYAFKDIALQFLGNLFDRLLSERGEALNIAAATSGDTGSAAIYGVAGKKNIKIAVLYPHNRISAVQEKQMTAARSENCLPLAVDGASFDDCQKIVKQLFKDTELKKRYPLGAVNSINWARILSQIVYYFSSYLKLNTSEKVYFAVPTGNFGNIFAGYCAMRMGLPVEKLVIVCNANDILHRFISSGDYSIKGVAATHSPSMDIEVASNLERYLFYLYGEDHNKLSEAMLELANTRKINFTDKEVAAANEVFLSCSANDSEIEETIASVYDKSGYILDPHSACGVYAASKLNLPRGRSITLATAHPAKFCEVVEKSAKTKLTPPNGLRNLPEPRREIVKNSYEYIKSVLNDFFGKSWGKGVI
ncbi:MAG: threonine synthase [Deferribacteraceae bacterium]|jgi:threonine synthase|nr:threonine synthase [Deferribacteraceae bacterium]